MADAHFVQDLILVLAGMPLFPHQDVSLPDLSVFIARHLRSKFRARRLILATNVLTSMSLVSMDDDFVWASRLVFSRQLIQTHEALNVRVVHVQHAREICQESTINTCKIMASELIPYVEAGALNIE